MPAAMGLATCFYNNMTRNGSPSHSALELSQQQNKDMHTLIKSGWPGCGPARGSIDSCVVWDSSDSKPTTNLSRALDQQQGRRQHPHQGASQRLLVRLIRYNVKAEYSPGKTLVVSNAPPRRSPIHPCPRLKKMSTLMSFSSSPIFQSHREREASCRHPRDMMQLCNRLNPKGMANI